MTMKTLAATLAAFLLIACSRAPEPAPGQGRSFANPDEAVKALSEAVKARDRDGVLAIFGADAIDLVDSTDPALARRHREVFAVALAERSQLIDAGADRKTLVVGNEQWPFPLPLVRDARGWRFDVAAGREEVLARRIGRNELAAIRICHTYVGAQQLYAKRGHDGSPAGVFARTFRSDDGRENGLYWPQRRGGKRSPLGDLVASAAAEGHPLDRAGEQPAPFHGYYYRILTAQGASASGGARDYVINDRLSGGFALVAWPAEYDGSGIMTFLVNHDGTVYQKDLGPETAAIVRAMTTYNPDGTWAAAQ